MESIESLNTSRNDAHPVHTKGVWFVVFFAAALLYLLTAQRGVSWQDSGHFQWRVLEGDYVGSFGLALAHPLYIAAGRVLLHIPLGNFFWRLNFFSGLGMAVALANLSAVMILLTRRRWIGLAVAGMLAVVHTVWWLSTIAEVYTWSAAGLTAELWMLVLLLRKPDWKPLAGLALINGLGLCVHNFALLPLPVYVVAAIWLIVRRKLPVWSLPAAALVWLIGASWYVAMTIQLAASTGDVFGAIGSALFGQGYGDDVLNVGRAGQHFKANMALASLNFVSLVLPLAILGWWVFRRRLGGAIAAALGAITLIEVIFVARYSVPDQFTFLIPSLVMIALAAGVGLAELDARSLAWRRVAVLAAVISIVLPPLIYGFAPAMLRATGLDKYAQRQRELPYRREVRYWVVPWKQNENSAERFAHAALKQAGANGVILADSTSVFPLLGMQRFSEMSVNPLILVKLPKTAQNSDGYNAIFDGHVLFVVSPSRLSSPLKDSLELARPENQPLYVARWR